MGISKKTGIVLFFIVLVGAFLRLYHIDSNSFWNDELLTIQFVNHSVSGMFGVIWPKEMNMALYYLLCNLWFHLFAYPSEGTLRMLSVIFSVLCIPAVYFLGRTVSDDKKIATATGLAAALLVAVNAFNIQYAQELRSYSLLSLLSVLSTLLFIKAIRNPYSWKTWAGYVLVGIAGMYSHYFFALLLFAQLVSLAVIFAEDPRNIPWKQLIISYAALTVFVVPQVIAALIAGTGGVGWIPKPNFGDFPSITSAFSGIHNGGILFYVFALFAGLFMGQVWSKKEIAKNWVIVLFASCLFLPACLILVESELHTPLFQTHYFIFSQPYAAIIAAFGIAKIMHMRNRAAKWGGAALLVLVLLLSGMGVYGYFTTFHKEDWRGVAQFLGKECSGSNELRLYYSEVTRGFTSFYVPHLTTQDPGLENALDNSSLDAIENLIPTNYSKVCFVVRRQDTQQEAVRTALQTKYPNMIPAPSFSLLKVYMYEK